MVKRTAKKAAKAMNFTEALIDPDNGKQSNYTRSRHDRSASKEKEKLSNENDTKKGRKEKDGRNDSMKRSESRERKKRSNSKDSRKERSDVGRQIEESRGRKSCTTRVAFEEDNEIMDLEVTAEQEREYFYKKN